MAIDAVGDGVDGGGCGGFGDADGVCVGMDFDLCDQFTLIWVDVADVLAAELFWAVLGDCSGRGTFGRRVSCVEFGAGGDCGSVAERIGVHNQSALWHNDRNLFKVN